MIEVRGTRRSVPGKVELRRRADRDAAAGAFRGAFYAFKFEVATQPPSVGEKVSLQ